MEKESSRNMVSSEQIYTEVDGILNLLGEDYIKKLPPKLYELIQTKKSKQENIIYEGINQIAEKNTSKEAISIIALFHLNYWCNVEEKEDISLLLNKNHYLNEQEKKERYEVDKLFKNVNNRQIVKNDLKSVELLPMEKKNFFRRFIEKIRGFFKKG